MSMSELETGTTMLWYGRWGRCIWYFRKGCRKDMDAGENDGSRISIRDDLIDLTHGKRDAGG